MSERTLQQQVLQEAQEAVAPLRLVVDDLVVQRAGKRRLVRIAVDDDLSSLDPGDETTPVEPVALDTVADATRLIDASLESSDAMGPAPYVLEVTSPGLSRPLTQPRHFRRNVGRLVTAQLRDGGEVTGRIAAAGADGVRLSGATGSGPTGPAGHTGSGNDPGEQFVEYAALSRAQVQVEFNRPGAPENDDLDADTDPHSEEQED
ncbi:ribosome maturation factor RimP [Piscicoccus intestinalis]|uniref:ribosome maturation factor RimP n=1 Tax=Piscicoccus intestinalis TaxID=746033 RepID=UPI0008381E1C|nr:hypothetical protein [Piscicoccus intestinalis]